MQDKVLKILEFDKIISTLVSNCSCLLGKERAENLHPSCLIDDVKQSQHETSQAVSMLLSKGMPPFGGLKDIRTSIQKSIKGAILNPKELIDIADVLRASRNLKAYHHCDFINSHHSHEHHHRYDILDTIFESLYSNNRVENRIFSCILNEEEISDTASPALHSIRRQISDSEQKIKEKLNSLVHSSTYQKYLQENIVTIRSGRYVLPVKQEFRHEVPGLVHDSSASGATLFIEPMSVVEANNAIKQLKIKENLEIEKILSELTVLVAEISHDLLQNVEHLARLDFIFAKAKLSTCMKAVQPKINQTGCVNLKKARHPLLNADYVVPIDIMCGDDFNTLVVTGPNTGGKTVTLKTVGLLTLMAQAGLHIPADEGSEINVFQSVFADIGDEQSIEQSLSTFSSHMVNIIQILEQVDSNTLVLLDELGSGTDPVEGAAIAMAILEYLHNSNAKTIATTHYSELKSFAINRKGIENASCEFDVETLRPTYRLLIGVPGRSNAFAISQKLGLSDNIISKAREFISKEDTNFEDIIALVETNRIKSEKQLDEVQKLKSECQSIKAELIKQKEALDNQKKQLIKNARQEAKEIIEDAKAEAEKILSELKILSSADEPERNKKGETLKNQLRKRIKDFEESLVEPLYSVDNTQTNHIFKAGDLVYITSLDQEGTVLSVPDENNNIQVQAGIIKLKIHTSQLSPAKKEKVSLDRVGISKVISNKNRVVSLDLDLRGQSLEEALDNTDKYLDDAVLTGLQTVTIIHGKGTGVLRSGIHQFLKKHPHVSTFRLGKFGEGEQGVTIVELK